MRYENTPPPVPDLGPDATLIGAGQQPLHFPYIAVPGWIVLSDLDSAALGAYGFLRTFVNETTGEWMADLKVREFADRFGVGTQAVSKTRKGKPGGMVQRLAALGALTVHPRWNKRRDCTGCGTAQHLPCPASCTTTTGRERAPALYEMAPAPRARFCWPGALDLSEYREPKRIHERVVFEANVDPRDPERRQIFPFYQALAWVALHPQLGPAEVGVYLFLCAHTTPSQGKMRCRVRRERIAERFGINEGTVSQITSALEDAGAIVKAGVAHAASGHRHGSGRSATYIVQVEPPRGWRHPYPLHVGEWREPRLVQERLSRQRKRRSKGGSPRPGVGYPQGSGASYPQAPFSGSGPQSPAPAKPGYPQGQNGRDTTSDLPIVDNSGGWVPPASPATAPPASEGVSQGPENPGYPQGQNGRDTTPDLGIVDSRGGWVLSDRGLGPVGQGVGSCGRDITNYVGTNYLGTTQGSASPSVGAQAQDGREAAAGPPDADAAAEADRLRAAEDLAESALRHLPAGAAPLRSARDRVALIDAVAARLREGFTVVQMGEALTVALEQARSAWVLTVRAADPARWLPEARQRPAGARAGGERGWCGECESPDRRYLLSADESLVRRCPDCHPLASPPWAAL